ncbi:MAG: helix-turn-helix domain-containing protein [Thiohalocapsa sp.]|jgi:transcriptional regulator with XRE-family HTH domain|nr:helix-turn-helix domain-containing protein [Thiohalocapsa sp.]
MSKSSLTAQQRSARAYSRYAREAAVLLGKQVRLARKQRGWTERELSERAGIARATLQKIEKGDPRVALGLAFEVAALVGVKLFDPEAPTLAEHIARTDDKLALLPAAVRRRATPPVDDDF